MNFGNFDAEFVALEDLSAAVILGIVCGLLGAFYTFISFQLMKCRALKMNKIWKQLVEAFFICLITAIIAYFMAY